MGCNTSSESLETTIPLEEQLLKEVKSDCSEPQTVEDLLLTNNHEKIQRQIETNETFCTELLEKRYEQGGSLLHLASQTVDIDQETMTVLIKFFAKNNQLHLIDNNKMEPLHIAAACANITALKVLFQHMDPKNKDRCCSEGRSPYNVLIKDAAYEQYVKNNPDLEKPEHQRRIQCIECMLENNLDINKIDFGDKSPIFWAASNGYKHIVNYILGQQYQQVDIDNVSSGKTPRAMIMSRRRLMQEDDLPEPFQYVPPPADTLFNYLKHRSINEFSALIKSIEDEEERRLLVNADNQTYTLLQFACVKNIHQMVNSLLEGGADPNLTIPQNPKTPLEQALSWGNADVLQLLLDCNDIDVPPLILHPVLEYAHNYDPEVLQDKLRCVEMILMSKKYSGICKVDEDGFVPLNYTTLVPEFATKLLANGASLATRNEYNILSIKYLDFGTLKAHLNNCVKEEMGSDKEEMYIKNYTATYDFRSLLPSDQQPEDDPPPVTPSSLSTESDAVLYMSRNPELQPLLKHPVVKSYLIMKWHLLRWFFYVNVWLYIIYSVCQFLYVYDTCVGNPEHTTISAYFLTAIVALFCIREVTELVLLKRYYLFPREAIEDITIVDINFDNLHDISLILMSCFILFSGNIEPEIRRPISILVVLNTAVGLVFNLERMPIVNNKMAMLKRVSGNLFKTFVVYFIIILPFALSFSILYKQPDDAKQNDDIFFFNNFYLSVFKSIIMMTGEYEMKDSIDFETYPIVSSVLFSLFVFFVAIIVFNLLTGLAVSDTQAIVTEAEILGLISRTQHICYVESMLRQLNVRQVFCMAKKYAEIKVYPNKSAQVIFPTTTINNGFSVFARVCMFFGINWWTLKLGDNVARNTLSIIEERNAKQRRQPKKRVVDLETENMGLKKRIKELKTEIRTLREHNQIVLL